jgi:hypothetical protein
MLALPLGLDLVCSSRLLHHVHGCMLLACKAAAIVFLVKIAVFCQGLICRGGGVGGQLNSEEGQGPKKTHTVCFSSGEMKAAEEFRAKTWFER